MVRQKPVLLFYSYRELGHQKKNIPIRIGVNMGSLEKDLFAKYGKYGVPRVMVESATRHVKILESLDYLYQLKPSKWNEALVTRFKWNLLPTLLEIVSVLPDDWKGNLKTEPTSEEISKEVGLI